MKKILALFFLALLTPSWANAQIADKVVHKNVGGIDVLVYPTSIKNVVTMSGTMPGGDVFATSEGNPALAQLTGMMLDRGTVKEDKFSVSRRLEDVGAMLGFNVGNQSVGLSGRFLTPDLDLVVGLLADQLRTPAFAEAEFEKARKEYIGSLRTQMDSPSARAARELARSVYPVGHPNHAPSIEELIAAAEKTTLADVKAYHGKIYGPGHMTLVFVGDVDPAQAQTLVGRAFAGWTGGVAYVRTAPNSPKTAKNIEVNMPGKTSTTLMMGEPIGLRSTDADALPLQIGAAILGQGFRGRLLHVIRDKEGLTYGIGAGIGDDTYVEGSLGISGTFAPQLVDRGIASTQRELRLWWEKGVTDQELVDRKTNLIGNYQLGLAQTGGLANTLLNAVVSGRDVTWLDEYPRAVQATTTDQINKAIRKYVDPDKIVIVKAGNLSGAAAK